MRIHAEKRPANRSAAVAGRSVHQTGGAELASRIVDSRPETAQLARFQLLANNSPQAVKAAQLQDEIGSSPRMVAQRQRMERMFGDTAQLAAKPEEEDLQMKAGPGLLQLQGMEEEEPLQGKFGPVQREQNKTGLPDRVKAGVENLPGVSLDKLNVHFNSSKPAQLNALAYTQGTDIHVGPGQEKHLPHEARHVIQQSQGRVKPTVQMAGTVRVNDDARLEREADVMGAKAIQLVGICQQSQRSYLPEETAKMGSSTTQTPVIQELTNGAGQLKRVIQMTFGWAMLGAVAGGALTAYLTGGLTAIALGATVASGLVSNYLSNLVTNEDDERLAPPNERGEQAEALVQWGRAWFARVWAGGDYAERDEMIDQMNEALDEHNMTLRRGWQPYDPVIRQGGRAESYSQLAAWASRQADGGRQAAGQFLEWVQGGIGLSDLPAQMRSMAVITHFAEVGRGYQSSLSDLYSWLTEIRDAESNDEAAEEWQDYNDAYAPSLKYAEDNRQEWHED